MGGHLTKLAGDDVAMAHLTLNQMLIPLLHSVAVGIILVIATFYEVKYLSQYPALDVVERDDDEDSKDSGSSPESVKPKKNKPHGTANLEIFLGAANLLFLCVGLTGIMLLVQGNLARAFAIAAALALTRFRIKLDQKSINASLLFAILIGMACGLGEATLAWIATGIYIALFLILLLVVNIIKPRDAAPNKG